MLSFTCNKSKTVPEYLRGTSMISLVSSMMSTVTVLRIKPGIYLEKIKRIINSPHHNINKGLVHKNIFVKVQVIKLYVMCDMCCTFLCNEYLGYTYLLMRHKDKKWDSVNEDFDYRICIAFYIFCQHQ